MVYAFAGNGQQLRWGGTLVVTTFGGDRIELPIDLPAVAALSPCWPRCTTSAVSWCSGRRWT